MITDDAILVNMTLEGKREAFDELVRKHRSRVLSAARILVGSVDGAEDVAQQAFLAAFANLRLPGAKGTEPLIALENVPFPFASFVPPVDADFADPVQACPREVKPSSSSNSTNYDCRPEG